MCQPLYVAADGKLSGLRTPPPPSGPPQPAPLFHISDGATSLLVDTGAMLSVLPVQHLPQGCSLERVATPLLTAANGAAVATHGCTDYVVRIGRLELPWRFIVADVSAPIIGADFLAHHRISVDLAERALRAADGTVLTTAGSPTAPVTLHSLRDGRFDKLWTEFPAVTQPRRTATVQHEVTHHIQTTGPPSYSRPRRLAPDRLAVARQHFDRLLTDGVIRPSKSPWASPLHMVPKAGSGEWRPCGDYRQLNVKTLPDRYPVPYLRDFTAQLHGCTIFSAIDLQSAYYHIPVEPADVPKTAVTTPFGLFEFLKMPFGLLNASQTFQRFINSVLRDVPATFAYIDDILVASKTADEHQQHLRLVFQRLQDHGLIVNRQKSVLGVPQLTFLGHDVSAAGISPPAARVAAIRDFKQPTTDQEVSRFVGMASFYHRFIPNAATLLQPLAALLPRKLGRKPRPVAWTENADAAFRAVKAALSEAVRLTHPVPGAPLSLQVDASDTGAGAVLQQFVADCWQPLGFFSRRFKPVQTRYSTFGRELLGVYLAVRHFRHALEGREVIIFTDHKPLTSALTAASDRHSPRETRHLDYVAQFTSDIRHVPGKDNVAADALSRTVAMLSEPRPPLHDFSAMAAAQQEDSALQEFLRSEHSLRVRRAQLPDGSALLVDDSTGAPRPLVPEPLRRPVFRQLHSLSHPGVKATQQLISARFVWPGMAGDVKRWTQACRECQRSKVTRHTRSPPAEFQAPDDRFSVVHVDLVGPLPPSEGQVYLLTCADRFTRWVEAVPLENIRAENVCRKFVETWVSRFGVPDVVVTDRGSQFTSSSWTALSERLGFTRRTTTAYHPCSNGLVERVHRTLKTALCSADAIHWVDSLPLVLLGLRSALKTDLGCSAAELVYGTTLRLPGDFVDHTVSAPPAVAADYVARLRRTMSQLRHVPPRSPERPVYVPRELRDASHVLIRRDGYKPPLVPPYDGPFAVSRRTDKTVTVLRNGREDTIAIDRVKPAFIESPAGTARTTPASESATGPSSLPAPSTGASGPELILRSSAAPVAAPRQQQLQPAPAGPTDTASARELQPILRTRAGRVVRLPAKFRDGDRRVTFLVPA